MTYLSSAAQLSATEIVAGLRSLLGEGAVDVDPATLQASSVDRFRKYTAVHGIFDGPIPAAVVTVADTDQVATTLSWANAHRVAVVPRTGRTATEGGLETVVENSIVVDGSAMDQVVSIDPINMMATAQCGVKLQDLEDAVREFGLTTGHSPQSKPLAQMGGLAATRSIGQFSTLYGGIEDMVVGLEAVLPDGTVTRIKNVPRRAAGPDIRHVVVGNEGALCFITEVTVKLFRHYPDNNRYFGYLVDDMDTGLRVLREVVTNGFSPSVCRVYSPEDARQHFASFCDDKCVLVFVAEGPSGLVEATAREIEQVVGRHRHTVVDSQLIADWFAQLNWGMDKIVAEQEAMLQHQHLGYTTEVSANWSAVNELYTSVMHRIRTEFPAADDLTMLGAHSSHSYQTGTNLYFVYDYTIDCEPRDEITKYHIPLNAIIVEEALRVGGSMVHHHGIGKYRTAWTAQEHGSALPLLTGLKRVFDPNQIMNPGTIFPL